MNLTTLASLLDCPPTEPMDIAGFCIDSRALKPGQLFLALRGERFDGHHFIHDAVAKGAAAVICEQFCDNISIPQLLVPSTQDALVKMATFYRQTLHCPVIALTGSNGKTSVKEMIASILPQPSFATPGNHNNHIGVPLSVLEMKPEHRYAVFELGANHPKEIAYTAAIVKPQIALINNIAPAHIEGFGSIEGVAETKGEIYQSLPANGTAIVNQDDAFAHFWDEHLVGKKVLGFSLNKPVDFHARSLTYNEDGCAKFNLVTPSGDIHVTLQVPGEHTVINALAAAACCYAAGINLETIAQGLKQFKGVGGRLTFLKGKNEAWIIDDTYNANLRSVLTAVDVLSKRQGFRILVLGDMGELGAYAQQHHEEIGHTAQNKGIDLLMTCGKNSEYTSKAFGDRARHYQTQDDLAQDLLRYLEKNTTVLVKGSRSAAMEKIVHKLMG